jgi:glycosyltransferase involved in cell wall biosynthesis
LRGTDDRKPLATGDGSGLSGAHVAMVVFSYYPADPRPRRAAETLVNEGASVELICLRESTKDPIGEQVNGVDVRRVRLRRRRGGALGYLLQYTVFLSVVMTILAVRSLARRYDLVYIHNMPDVLVLGALIPRMLGAKVILDLHDPMPELMMTIFNFDEDSLQVRALKRLEKWSIGRVDRAFTVNLACKRLFVSRSCYPEKMHVVMNSPDEQLFRLRLPSVGGMSCGRGSDPIVMMYHGSLLERNGLDLAVEALARVPRDLNVALRVYGAETVFLERVMELVQSKGLEDRVQYLGPRDGEGIVQAIGECDLGVIPNRRNAFTELNTPTRIFEYLALGKAVIAPSSRGIQDYFCEDSLIFFRLGDSEDLARKIEYVCRNPREVHGVVERGQEVYRAHAWRLERQKLVDEIGDLLRGGARIE